MRAAVIVLLLAVTSSVAVAQPGMTSPLDAAPPAQPTASKKSGSTATLLALAGTVVPILIVRESLDSNAEGSGILLGLTAAVLLPSAGYWYAGKFWTIGMGMRLLGGVVATGSLFVLVNSEGDADGAEGAFFAGAGTFVVGTLYDIVTASSAVDDWNRKYATQPTVLRTGDGYGVGFRGRF